MQMRRVEVLSGEWAIREHGGRKWIPGKVPGNLCSNLFQGGVLEDPRMPDNLPKTYWVNDSRWDWIKRFSIDLENNNLWVLVFRGIKGRATVRVNGVPVRRRCGISDITHLIQEDNELVVSFQKKSEKRQLNLDGIIDNVFLIGSEDVMITLMFTYAYESNGLWHIHVELEIYSVKEMVTDCLITVQRAHEVRTETITLDLHRGFNRVTREIPLPYVELWEPWDLGEQVIYSVRVSVVDDGTELDSTTEFVGFRRVEWTGWRLQINGKDEFIRGAEWSPPDLFLGEVDEQKYLRMLSLALNSNINLLMLSTREKEDFYTICDNLGIMVWHATSRLTTKRSLAHPSVIILPESGESHTGTHIISDRPFMRNIEFVQGARSVPGFVVTRRRFTRMISSEKDLRELVVTTQISQALDAQKNIEAMRLKKGQIGGIVFQKFNDAEPCISESLIDFFGGTKLAYYKLKQSYNIVIACMKMENAEDGSLKGSLWVINDLNVDFRKTTVQVFLAKKGEEIELFNEVVDIPKNGLFHVGDVRIPKVRKGAIVRTRITSKGYILGENNYDLGFIKK